MTDPTLTLDIPDMGPLPVLGAVDWFQPAVDVTIGLYWAQVPSGPPVASFITALVAHVDTSAEYRGWLDDGGGARPVSAHVETVHQPAQGDTLIGWLAVVDLARDVPGPGVPGVSGGDDGGRGDRPADPPAGDQPARGGGGAAAGVLDGGGGTVEPWPTEITQVDGFIVDSGQVDQPRKADPVKQHQPTLTRMIEAWVHGARRVEEFGTAYLPADATDDQVLRGGYSICAHMIEYGTACPSGVWLHGQLVSMRELHDRYGPWWEHV